MQMIDQLHNQQKYERRNGAKAAFMVMAMIVVASSLCYLFGGMV